MSQPRLIKKYANRRLYDTEASAHVTLDGVRELIVSGHDVQVIDDTSGEDITRSILLQIIAEREQGGRPMLGTDFLARLIRSYGNPMQDFVSEFLARSFDAFQRQQAMYQEQMRKAMDTTPLEIFRKLAEENLKSWQAMQDAFLKPGPKRKPKPEE